jgi:hypothetical protein
MRVKWLLALFNLKNCVKKVCLFSLKHLRLLKIYLNFKDALMKGIVPRDLKPPAFSSKGHQHKIFLILIIFTLYTVQGGQITELCSEESNLYIF